LKIWFDISISGGGGGGEYQSQQNGAVNVMSKMEPSRILITGATGFVGSAVVRRLLQENFSITATVLTGEDAGNLPADVERVIVPPLSDHSDYSTCLQNIDIVIHLAARVHIMQETATNPLREFRKVNLYGTERLARQAAKAGVKRFVFMSTIGVNGNTSCGRAFTECDIPRPHNDYSTSKLEAEISLREISEKSGMEVVIARAPLVYGPGNPGNFLSLLRVISKGIPLPLASVSNKKSFIYVANLADALKSCAAHPSAANQTYLVSDCEDLSTPELLRSVASALGMPVRLLPIPISLIRIAGMLAGKSAAVRRLLDPLQVDSSKIRRELGWKPPFTMEEGLLETAKWFKGIGKR
jgi:UDP-N-acetyl-alpha-D-quinovosamine dehydrogenase